MPTYPVPSVSVVIPNKDYGAFLSRAIDSCLVQTILPREIFVVDGGSTDDSLEIIARYPSVKLLQWESPPRDRWTMGVPKNMAISPASGEFIITLDSDDYLAPTYVEECLEAMASDVGIVCTGVQCFGDHQKTWNPPAKVTLPDIVASNLLFTASMFRREAWEQEGRFSEEHTFEDWDLWIRVMAAGWKVVVVPKPLFFYRAHAASLSQSVDVAHTESLKRAIREKYAHLLAPKQDKYVPPGIEGWMEDEELQWLYETAKRMQTIVEIGSWKGRSTHALCSGCPGTVTAVDHFHGSKGYHLTELEGREDAVYQQFVGNTRQFPNLRVIRKDSVEAAAEFADGSVDMVFIDGDHAEDATRADIKAWLPKAKKMITGHDYSRHFPGVCKAVDQELGAVERGPVSVWFKKTEKQAVAQPVVAQGSVIYKKRGLTIYARDDAGRAGDQAIITEQFEMDIYRLNQLERLIQPKTILDVGGHIGGFGLNAKSRWPTALLVAYEPKGDSADLYRKNLYENGFAGTGAVIPAAISYEKDKTMLSDNPSWTGGGIMVNSETQKALPGHYRISESEVMVVDLEQALEESGLESIDLLKLDCEGAEMGMLRHMHPDTARKIGFVVGEYHCQTGDYIFHGGSEAKDRINGYKGFADLVQWRFPWFDVMPLGTPSNNIGNFAAGPPAVIAKMKAQADMDSVAPMRTPLGNQIILSFTDGARVTIEGPAQADYQVRFNNLDTGENVYTTTIRSGHWASANPKYYVRWEITVDEDGRRVLDFALDLTGRHVRIVLTSKSLGDTLCWMPYADEFRKQHQCKVTVETFWRSLLESVYPDIAFCDANTFSGESYAAYRVGCFDSDYNRNPINWRVIPLQQVASDTLGLRYREIKPKVKRSDAACPIEEPYVCISEFSTLQCKHWNHPDGWQRLADHLMSRGLKVVSVGETWPRRVGVAPSPTNVCGAISRNGLSVEDTLPVIQNAEIFVGVGAGYAWTAWALDVPVVLISGFSDPWVEMKDCIRVHDASVCHGCYNDPSLPFDRNNWNWCPRGRNFECSRSITPDAVWEKMRYLVEAHAVSTSGIVGTANGVSLMHGRGLSGWTGSPRPSVLVLCPHLSTGGLPQYSLWRGEEYLRQGAERVEFVEWKCLSPDYVVQRNKIEQKFSLHMLNGDKLQNLRDLVESRKPPAIIHIQEFVECWLPDELCSWLYRSSRPYQIVETCHDSSFRPEQKHWIPDRIESVCRYHNELFRSLTPGNFGTMEYAPEPRTRPERRSALLDLNLNPAKKHVLNVGLFTPGKNQGEILEIARRMPDVEFHFVGNQAPNFAYYWKPLMEDRPRNCVIWGEREDVDRFYASMDLLLFASTSELAPLVPKEALAWGMPLLMRNLPIYEGRFDSDPLARYIAGDLPAITETLREALSC